MYFFFDDVNDENSYREITVDKFLKFIKKEKIFLDLTLTSIAFMCEWKCEISNNIFFTAFKERNIMIKLLNKYFVRTFLFRFNK